MNSMTMTEVYETAKAAAAAAYAAGRYNLSRAFTNAQALAQEALEAEAEEYECTMALFSSFSSQEAEQDALEAERVAASAAAWARMAAWSAWEAAQDAYNAEEEEEVREYEARQAAAHAAQQAKEEEEEAEYRAEGIIEFLSDLPQGDREWVCGEEDPVTIAREWTSQGFTALGVREWAFRARCYRAEAARALIVLGINPEEARALAPQGDTVGYACAAGDMSPTEAALALLQV